MSVTKIINAEECGWKELHFMFNQILVSKRWPLSEEIDIDYVRIVQDRSKRTGPGAIKQASSSIVATMLFGLAGTMLTALQEGYEVDVDMDIVLTNGKVIEIRAKDKKLVTYLAQFIVLENPRTKYRKQRGRG